MLRASRAASALAVRSLPRRLSSAVAPMLAVALVVLVLLGFLAMRDGYRNVLLRAGDEDIAVLTSRDSTTASSSVIGRDQLTALEEAPGIELRGSRLRLSPETTVAASLPRRDGAGRASLIVRGIESDSGFMTAGVSMIEGRPPTAGSQEIIVGRAATREFEGLEVGQTAHFGGADWKIVGIFSASGGVYESEARGDLKVIQTLFRKGPVVQWIRARLSDRKGLSALQKHLQTHPVLALKAASERAYFTDLASRSGSFIQQLGWPLALLMAVGALAGAANAMYASIEARASEIATMRAIGFGRLPITVGVLSEALLITLAGGTLGVLISLAVFSGIHSSTLSGSLGQVMFDFRVSAADVASALLLAGAIGLLASIAPALKAASSDLAVASRE